MLKVGDKVRITGDINAHGFKIGEIVTIEKTNKGNGYRAKNNNESWWICEEECELIKDEKPMLNTVISHKIATVDEKGYVKQQIDLTHEEYLSLVEQLATEVVEIQEDNNESLYNFLFGGK
jgi:hypothetical protein